MIDEHGKKIDLGTVSNTMQIRVLSAENIASQIFKKVEGRDPKIQRALAFQHRSLTLLGQQNTPEAFLAMFLALESLEENLNAEQEKYRFIRHTIAHVEVGKERPREFLLREFGTETPNWDLTEMRLKLLKWYNKLEAEVAQLLRDRLK